MTPDYRERTAAVAAYFENLSPASVALTEATGCKVPWSFRRSMAAC